MPLVLLLLQALALSPVTALAAPVEQPWFSLDGLAQSPAQIQTKIPFSAALVEGPGGHRALSVTVPDMSRDERACAFVLALPKLTGSFNAVRVWVRGTAQTQHLEIVFRTATGSFGADVPLTPEWREVMLSAQNTHPYFDTKGGHLVVTDATEVRFCFGEWQGHRGGPHTVSVGPMAAVASPEFSPPGPVETVATPDVPRPLQPFIVELLDLHRGEWEFVDALGQRLNVDGPVVGFAFPEQAPESVRLAYLCCDPEFPDDLGHAVLKIASPTQTADGATWFRLDEPHFAATVKVSPLPSGALLCELSRISLGPATTGDRYVAGLYVLAGKRAYPVWLAPDDAKTGLSPRLLTDRVGHVFTEGEPVRVTLANSWAGDPPARRFAVRVTEYATDRLVWQGEATLTRRAAPATTTFEVPVTRFGIFEVTATAPGAPPARLRLCRVPKPREIDPDRSAMGINLFQQQIWSYAYQTPLMARAGVHWIRPWLAWENVWNVQEPEPGRWDTRALDAALRRMAAYGQRYQLILWGAPSWVSGSEGFGVPPVEKLDAWSAYVEKLVRQYRGRVRYYEVWNEPDGMWPEKTRAAGEHYVALLKATYAAAKRADPDCVVLGISHAGWEEWLDKLGALGARDFFDIATLHCYATPADFVHQVERRRAILERGGMGEKPIWINELGTTAYDFSPAYSAQFGCSERNQASVVPALYAEALSLDPAMKAYWFCTYDPRDAAHKSQWTGDAGIGVLYLGFLPKLSYAALAGTARELDGRRCLGRVDPSRDLHQISFEGPVAVVWHDRPAGLSPIPATDLGCLPGERITVRDLFTNEVATGRAADVKLDLSRGTCYVEGSRRLAALASCESALRVTPEEVALTPGAAGTVRLIAPAGLRVSAAPSPGLPVSATVEAGTVRVAAPAGAERSSGSVRVSITFPTGQFGLAEPHEVVRWLAVVVGAPNLVRDGGFVRGDLAEWAPERTSPYTWDRQVGHAAPGSLRLDGPFDRRLVHWNIRPTPGRSVQLRAWVRTDQLDGCLASLSVALFAPDRWLKTWCLARTDQPNGKEMDWPTIDRPGRIPSGTTDWTLVEATLSGSEIPPETQQIAFVVDVRNGSGRLWIDDLDLWQPAP